MSERELRRHYTIIETHLSRLKEVNCSDESTEECHDVHKLEDRMRRVQDGYGMMEMSRGLGKVSRIMPRRFGRP